MTFHAAAKFTLTQVGLFNALDTDLTVVKDTADE